MAEIRFNYGDKFTQTTNTNTGIGSTIPAAKLDIAGGTSAGSLRVSGIATLPSYQGFVNTKLTTPTEGMIVEAGQSGSISGEVVIGVGQTISVSTGATTGQGGVQSLKVSQTFMPPVGGTADRPTDVKPGMLYYNKDFKTIEFWDGNFWKQVDNTTRSGRAIISTGYNAAGAYGGKYDFITISTLGNSLYFGDMITAVRDKIGCGSQVRALFGAGGSPTYQDEIDYLTIASKGDGTDFGDLTAANIHNSALSSSTRGIWGGGYAPSLVNTIEYVEISTLGDALDFGDLSGDMSSGSGYVGSCASPVRGLFTGGTNPNSPAGDNVIRSVENITIASKGNSFKFGDLSAKHQRPTATSNGIIGLIFSGGDIDDISAVNMSSDGNAVHFGDLVIPRYSGFSSCSKVRAVHGGGEPGSGGRTNSMEFVTISTAGNAQDFGDLSFAESFLTATSDSHGGLGGF